MNCCNGKNDGHTQEPNKNLGHLKHIFMMILCCGAPLLVVSLLPVISAVIPGSDSVLRTITPFLCPILMIGMIPMMVKEWKANSTGEKKAIQAEEVQPGNTRQDTNSGSCH